MMTFNKDLANKKLTVVRTFNAPVDKVWKAWTDDAILDQWWGPKPWRAQTKTMDFKNGGYWLYAMIGPEGSKTWSKVSFSNVNTQSFETTVIFCDEDGNPVDNFGASSRWQIAMEQKEQVTTVTVDIIFVDTASLEKLVAMGFEGGFTMGLNQLEELLAA
jgi:uncharacterized protein YndB with AHSA1/START domain